MLVRSFKIQGCNIGGVKNKIDTCRPEVCLSEIKDITFIGHIASVLTVFSQE